MDPQTRMFINSIGLLVIGSFLTFAATWFWRQRNKSDAEAARLREMVEQAKKVADYERRETDRRVAELEQQLSAVKQSVVPISAAFQAILIKELTHYHTPRMDELMERIGPPSTLSPAEEQELFTLLVQRTQDLNGRISDSEREAAEILPAVMRRAKVEALEVEKTKLAIVKVVETEGGDAKGE